MPMRFSLSVSLTEKNGGAEPAGPAHGGLDVQRPPGGDSGFRVNLFATDEEEEEASMSRPEELSYEVINIQATKDQQANEELARIMGEFTEEAEASQAPSDKGADLLAMMDGL
ncbi:hypothetical protein COCON_G00019260 [Conger conger]|uniref:Uncharacterized protein n=1 Tax=Conger conger TaxID=82655 RepID=A0A9Q1E415_CONCO|nr:hypothetical protein COCON_G00019260 [Conger conger]